MEREQNHWKGKSDIVTPKNIDPKCESLPACGTCRHVLHFSQNWDSLFCPKCDEWREAQCFDDECWCKKRPERPSRMD